MLGLFPGYKSGVKLKRVWWKQDKQDNLEEDKEDKRRQTIQYKKDKKDKKDNLKQDKDVLELGLWMLQLHAEGDGNSVRAGGCDVHSVVGYYAMLCKLYSKMKMCEYKILLGEDARKRLCWVLNNVYSMWIYQKMKKVTNLSE